MAKVATKQEVKFLTAFLNKNRQIRLDDNQALTASMIDRKTGSRDSAFVASRVAAKGFVRQERGNRYVITPEGIEVLIGRSHLVNQILGEK